MNHLGRRNSRASGAVTPPAPGGGTFKKPFLLRTLEKSYDAIAALALVVRDVRKRDRSLADQLRRAAQSIALNLAEARGRGGGNRRLRLESALGSTYETRACLSIATRWGYVGARDVERALWLLDEVAAMTRSMLHPGRGSPRPRAAWPRWHDSLGSVGTSGRRRDGSIVSRGRNGLRLGRF